ncbi:type II secretion system F family protein [Herbiconiux solani]|uniref:type II secretion system F family protein n=1 Tax=Herbiconiux solani TaxID=661329 RepID=UPI00082568CD|nr:type II secretion system F family protein [Herbiconiux solani]
MVERLAALVGAGVTPARAWVYVGEVSADPVVLAVAGRVADGVGPAAAIEAVLAVSRQRARHAPGRLPTPIAESWQMLAAAWSVATEAGAPLRDCLGRIAESLSMAGAVERQTAAALAGPTATARLVLALPVVAVAGGSLLGLDTMHILLQTPAGLSCLAAGLGLMLLGHLWSRRLLRRARSLPSCPGLALDLVAVAATGGVSPAHAIALVEKAYRRTGLVMRNLEEAYRLTGLVTRDLEEAREVLALAERAGAPPVELLRSEATRIRRDAVSSALRRASALEVWLMIPLGACVLPAFILLAIAPVLLGILPTAVLPVTALPL